MKFSAGTTYPDRDRTAWIVAQRPLRGPEPDPFTAHGVFLEQERLSSGEVVDSGVILLTNRECPWRCLMCDLWQHTTTTPVPDGAITQQVDRAVAQWAKPPVQVKLYNSGSFFDPGAIPMAEYAPVARQLSFARHVVVESHPRLVGERARVLRDALPGTLEVAIGLETADAALLAKLNKKFDRDDFRRAADFLGAERMALRVFLLAPPPFVHGEAAFESIVASARFAFACGASAVTLIPTRIGEGAMRCLHEAGEVTPPSLTLLEEVCHAVLPAATGRLFADTWGLDNVADCPACAADRRQRLAAMNLTQRLSRGPRCQACGRT